MKLILLTIPVLMMTINTMAQDKMPGIDSQVTFLYYKDLNSAEEFYGKALGLRKTFDQGWVRIFQISSTSYVGLVDETRGSHKSSESKPVMLSIVTSDVDRWYEVLSAKGIKIISKLSDSGSVPVRAFLIEDPEGYTVEFFQWTNEGIKTK